MGFSMHLTLASFNPQLIKGDIPQYCQGLTASTENNCAWYSNIFTVCSKEIKTPNTTLYNMEPLFTGKATSKNIPSSLTRKASIRYCWLTPVLLNYKEYILGFMCLHKEGTKPWLGMAHSTVCWPEIKDVKKLNQTASEGDSFPKMTGPDLYNISYCCFLH